MTIYCDFDNTLLLNPYDVDLTGNLDLFLKTWSGLNTAPFNLHLINWLSDKQFIICTNRHQETKEKVKQHLRELGLLSNCNGAYFCCGQKLLFLTTQRKKQVKFFLIDNNKTYSPNVLLSKNITIWDLNYYYSKFKREVENGYSKKY